MPATTAVYPELAEEPALSLPKGLPHTWRVQYHRPCGACYNRAMPTVLRHGPYRFYFYSHEPNEPPHVHVDRDEASAKFWLDPVQLAANFGFRAHELREIQSIVRENRVRLLEAWNGFFGGSGG